MKYEELIVSSFSFVVMIQNVHRLPVPYICSIAAVGLI